MKLATAIALLCWTLACAAGQPVSVLYKKDANSSADRVDTAVQAAMQEFESQLIDAGYDGSFTGVAYGSVFFQNSNNSVRVTDDFMRAVLDDGPWQTREAERVSDYGSSYSSSSSGYGSSSYNRDSRYGSSSSYSSRDPRYGSSSSSSNGRVMSSANR